ncbi:hypothetical protein AHiyo4_34510 [Arthrobacter sp. Hiyo4]|nr:hypothetical protein AHiyo4_34510 [Arthrobacter sp. Hiyo4]
MAPRGIAAGRQDADAKSAATNPRAVWVSWLSKAIRGRKPASRNKASVSDRMPYPGSSATKGSRRMSCILTASRPASGWPW